jgi:cell division transport system permease protein
VGEWLEMKKKEDSFYNFFMLIFLKRIIKFGWSNFSRNIGLSITIIFIMVIVISLMTALFLFQEMSQFFISYIQEKIDISVEFKIETPESTILEIKEELLKIPEVKSVEYISKEEALADFIERHKDDYYAMRSLEEVRTDIPYPFPAVLNIRAWELDQYKQIAAFLENQDFGDIIYRVDYHDRRLIIERAFIITELVNQVIIIFSLILALIAILITFNTIKLAILNQKDELIVQRLVGASNWFIKGPFLVQGMIFGFFAALVSLLIFISVIYFWGYRINILIPGFNISTYFFNQIFLIFLGQLIIGLGLGVISSAIAVRKHLKI